MDVFHCDKGFLNKDQFTEYIFNTLLTYKYAEEDTLSSVMRARKNDIVICLEDGLISYIKENPNIKIKDVCKTLKVNSSFIQDLIEQERLVINEGELKDLENDMSIIIEDAMEENSAIQNRSRMNALQLSMTPQPTNNTYHTGATFHTNYNKKGTR